MKSKVAAAGSSSRQQAVAAARSSRQQQLVKSRIGDLDLRWPWALVITPSWACVSRVTTGRSNLSAGGGLTAPVPMDNPYCSCKLTRVTQ